MKIAILLLFLGIVPYKQKEGCLELDILVLVDISGSLKGYEHHMKDALITLTDKIELSNEGIRMGVATFSNQGWLICPLTDNKPLLKEKFVNIISDEGGTHLANGIITSVNELLNGGRGGISKMLIIFSDGATDNGPQARMISQQLKTSGITICSVLIITDTVDKQLMKDISTNCYLESSYENLNKEIEKLDICI